MVKKKLSFTEIDIGNNFPSGISTHVDWEPRTNFIEMHDKEMWVIEVELPGVNKEDIFIQLEKPNFLIIRGVKRQPRSGDPNHVTYFLFEREFGSFYKRINIPFRFDVEKIQSCMENGVLSVKIQRKKSKKIKVEIT